MHRAFPMNQNQDEKKAPQYADSSISDKAFKRAICWFLIFCSVFIIGLILAVTADGPNMG